MQNSLNISLLQSPLSWENPEYNRMYFDKKIDTVKDADIVLLPEMFTTGFTMQPEKVAEKMNGETINWMLAKAAEKNCLIGGSVIIEENGKYYNRFIAAFPDGKISHSDKRHLFSFAGEDKVYTQGKERTIFTYKGFRIFPLICYDLRFPVWARYKDDYDLLIYVANWPAPRIKAWDTLLKARAIENMCYVAGLNRVGSDANDLQYPGHSAIINPLGEVCASSAPETETVITAAINHELLKTTRDRFGFLKDKDEFILE